MKNETTNTPKAPKTGRLLNAQQISWSARLRVGLVWLISAVLMVLILVVRLPVSGQVQVQVGDVAQRDVAAPRQVTYISEVLTEQRRTMAANAVPDVYDPPQARVGRQQLTLANQILDFIASVRGDSYAELARKTEYLTAISRLTLTPQVINRILTLPGPAWERVAAEVQVVLERAMREEIRENNLADERRKVPARVRLDFTDDDVSIVSDIVQDLLAPNSFYNAERTTQRRDQARNAVEPVTTTVERNETILRAGDIVTELDIEALRALGLQQSGWSWRQVWAATGLTLLLTLILLYYLWRQEPQLWLRLSDMILLASLLLIFVLAVKSTVPARTLMPYLFPYASLALILAIVFSSRIAFVTVALFALLVGWLTTGGIELMAFVLAGSFIGVLKLRRGDRLVSYAWAALYIMLANLFVVVVFRTTEANWDWQGLLELSAVSIVNGLAAITIALLGLYLIGALFGVTTPVQLLELSRPTHPLLRQLLLKAPGTYHHTLIVSNMAERAAEAIGADALLTRVGAYYHDVGKTIRPYFFVENRTESVDPHARLDPVTSAQIIVTHVKDGIDLARKYRLPKRIIDFIPEHQGTALVSYFYHQAKQQSSTPDTVDKSLFCYPGPKPQSPETAVTMLADAAEATVRSKHPASVEELDQIVGQSIQNRLLSGELDESQLTVADLAVIRQAFVDVLRGLHHPRIAYPAEMAPAAGAAIQPAPPAKTSDPAITATKESKDEPAQPNNSASSRAAF